MNKNASLHSRAIPTILGRLAVYDTGEREARFMAQLRQHIHGIGGKAASKQQAVNKRTTNNKQEH